MQEVKIYVDGNFSSSPKDFPFTYSTTDPKVKIQGSSIEVLYNQRVELQFELRATADGKALRWYFDPIQWKKGLTPRDTSKWPEVRVSDKVCRLTDPVEHNGSYSFILGVVDSKEKRHGSTDPTVVNKGAPGGGPDEEPDELMAWWRELRRRHPRAAREVLALAREIFAERYRR